MLITIVLIAVKYFMSLKKTIHYYIKNRYPKIFYYHEAVAIARSLGRKESNLERRLRNSESPEIETLYNNGAIMGYRYRKEYLENEARKNPLPKARTLPENQNLYKLDLF